MAAELGLDESTDMLGFTVTHTVDSNRRRLLAVTYTWAVSFEARTSLAASGHEDTESWVSDMTGHMTSDEFSSALSTGVGVDLVVDVDSVVAVRITRSPTPVPSEEYIVEAGSSSAATNFWFIVSGAVCILGLGVCVAWHNMRIGKLKVPFAKPALQTSHVKHMFINELLGKEDKQRVQASIMESGEVQIDPAIATQRQDTPTASRFYGDVHEMNSMTDLANKTTHAIGSTVQLRPIDSSTTVSTAETDLADAEASARRAEARLAASETEERRLAAESKEHRLKTNRNLRQDSSLSLHERRLVMLQDSNLQSLAGSLPLGRAISRSTQLICSLRPLDLHHSLLARYCLIV